jgi:hypothetical protein
MLAVRDILKIEDRQEYRKLISLDAFDFECCRNTNVGAAMGSN